MSKGVNKVIILGNVGEKETFEKVTKLSVATSEKWGNKETGEFETKTEWHRIVFFGKLAEIVNTYVEKGSKIYVEGKLQTTKYTDEKGETKWSTAIIANEMQLCGKREGVERPTSPPPSAYEDEAKKYPNKRKDSNLEEELDDLPF